ncbi:MAG: Helix-turn-helix domain, partial [Alphaproteobacteria bacterium]|nr:Helix-turn-helix domain [Alphaproteobacteria bacterium]
DSVYKLINSGQLPAKKIGRRTVIVAADLEKFLKDLPQIGSKVTATPAKRYSIWTI